MSINTDASVNTAYLKVQDGQIEWTAEVAPGVLLDLDAEGHILGIEKIGTFDFYTLVFDVLRAVRVAPSDSEVVNCAVCSTDAGHCCRHDSDCAEVHPSKEGTTEP